MKVFDCFTFFNEIELLEFRLKLLDEIVDHFVIAESNLTHSGKEKPYHFKNHIRRFSKWRNKIIYLPVHHTSIEEYNFSKNLTEANYDDGAWRLENEQRIMLSSASSLMDNEDLVIVSDLDELPDPDIIRNLFNDPPSSPIALKQLLHYYFLNCQVVGENRWWSGSVVARGSDFKTTSSSPQDLRDRRTILPAIDQAGWHFSYLGGIKKIQYKLQSFAHAEFNREEFTDDKNVMQALLNGTDILKRQGFKFEFFPLSHYPERISRLMKKYPHLISPSERPFSCIRFSWFKR